MVLQDVRYAWRSARKNPGFVAIGIATLALGIGANTAMFSIISGVLLRPLPYTAPDRLVQLFTQDRWSGTGPVHYGDVQDWRTSGVTFSGVIIYGNISKNLQGVDDPERISTVRTEFGLFDLLGVQAVAGRTFRRDDPSNVAVIGAALSEFPSFAAALLPIATGPALHSRSSSIRHWCGATSRIASPSEG